MAEVIASKYLKNLTGFFGLFFSSLRKFRARHLNKLKMNQVSTIGVVSGCLSTIKCGLMRPGCNVYNDCSVNFTACDFESHRMLWIPKLWTPLYGLLRLLCHSGKGSPQ